MRWSERQLAMLREMGIRVWAPASTALDENDDDAGAAATRVAEPVTAAATVAAPTARAPAIAYGRDASLDRPSPPTAPLSPRNGAAPIATAPMATAMAAAPLASAEWLVVGEPFDAVVAADPASAADQELLLDNMLRAIRVARTARVREGRACHFALDAAAPARGLDAAIAAVRPRVILALGRAAALALLGLDEPLGKLRERVHERAGIPVVVTFALPYLLRHAADKPRAWADLCRAVAALGPADASAAA